MRLHYCFALLITIACAGARVHAEDFAALKEIEGYQKWSFTRGPFRVSPGMETLCVYAPFVGHPETVESGSEYKLKDTTIRVYANEIAARKLSAKSTQPFEVGSVIMKEKFPGAKANSPESLGVMVKREAGFDPKFGDWDFIFLASNKRIARGSTELNNCYSCHQDASSRGNKKISDYVFVDMYK